MNAPDREACAAAQAAEAAAWATVTAAGHPAPALKRQGAMLRPAHLRVIVGLLHERGHDADAVLALAGLHGHELQHSQALLPLARLRWLVRALHSATGDPTLALQAGARMPLSALAGLGPVLAASPDLRRALLALQRFMPRQTPLLQAGASPAEGGLCWQMAPRVPLGELEGFVLDYATGALAQVFQTVCGGPLHEARLALPWPAPPWRRAHESLAGSVRFGAPALAWWLPDPLLDRPAPGGSADAFAAAWRACEAAEHDDPGRPTRTAQTDRWLREGGEPTLQALATELGLNPRTLIRHLAREGSSFQVRLDLWRREQALALLRDTDLPVAQIATRLGYRSATNFSRCLRRWFGTTPGALRQQAPDEAAAEGPPG